MANNKFKNKKQEDELSLPVGKPNGKPTKSGKPSKPAKDWKDMSKNRDDKVDYKTTNAAERAGANLVYPTTSAAAAAFGSFTTSPGQNNYIENFNQVTNEQSIGVLRSMVFQQTTKRTPSAMCIRFVPYFGCMQPSKGSSFMAPLVRAAVNLKQYIDTSFGTNTNYDPADLMAYIMACSAVWPMAAEIRRDLRLNLTVLDRQFPQFLPQGLYALLGIGDANHNWVAGEGCAYTAMQLRSLIDQFNRVVDMFNRLPMPKELAVFGYNDCFFDALYADTEDIATAQLYVFQTSHYWQYKPVASDLGSHLELMDWPRGANVQEKIAILAEVVEALSALRTSDSAMLQNLYNAYGTREFARMSRIEDENFTPLPLVYDEHILMMIENMNWGTVGSNGTLITDIQTLSATSTLEGHVCAPNAVASRWPNLPLQFHKPFQDITHDDIGWALRMHPTFLNNTSFHNYTIEIDPDTGEEIVVDGLMQGMTCDGFTGFAIPSNIKVIAFNDTRWDITTWNFRSASGDTAFWYESVFNDFEHAPMFINTTLSTPDEHTAELSLNWYDAHRDVEVTYRLGDLEMFWTMLTEDLYAGQIIRETLGTRKMQWEH